ncbi:MAG: hypothetical protein AAGF02_09925, partial [Actinomycetota bacterium]
MHALAGRRAQVNESGRAIFEWRITPLPAQLRTVDFVLLLLVGAAVIIGAAALVGDAQLRTYAVPTALLGIAAVLWQQRSWSLAFRLAVTQRGDLVFDDGRGRRQIVPLAGCEVGMCRRSQGWLRFGAPWRWAVELESPEGHQLCRELPALAGWFNPPAAEVEQIVAELTATAAPGGAPTPPVPASQV